jgi:hypothetical protein
MAQSKTAARIEGLQGIGQVIGLACIAKGQYADAAAIGTHGPNLYNEVAKLGNQYASVGKVLDYLTEIGPFAGVVGAALPLVLQIMANHGKVKPTGLANFGVVPPALLEAQAKKEAAELAKQAIRAQQEAEKEIQALQAEMTAA